MVPTMLSEVALVVPVLLLTLVQMALVVEEQIIMLVEQVSTLVVMAMEVHQATGPVEVVELVELEIVELVQRMVEPV